MRVLIVEDDSQSAEAVGALLAREGISVEYAGDGGIGLSKACDPSIDLMILDHMLPVMDGISVAARMRNAGAVKPVLMLSALHHRELSV